MCSVVYIEITQYNIANQCWLTYSENKSWSSLAHFFTWYQKFELQSTDLKESCSLPEIKNQHLSKRDVVSVMIPVNSSQILNVNIIAALVCVLWTATLHQTCLKHIVNYVGSDRQVFFCSQGTCLAMIDGFCLLRWTEVELAVILVSLCAEWVNSGEQFRLSAHHAIVVLLKLQKKKG